MTKAAQIRELLKAGSTIDQIVEKLKVKRQYVHSVAWLTKKRPKKRGRPAKKFVEAKPIDKNSWFDKQSKEIISLRQEINDLTAVIVYLEHRCARAEAGRGTSI